MNIVLNWEYSSDLVECPKEIAENLRFYQLEFDNWISNKTSKHNYFVQSEFGLALSFDSNAFVNWLNTYVLLNNQEKAKIIKIDIISKEEFKGLPYINF